MALSDLAIFNEQTHSAYAEVMADVVAMFNEASQGTMLLRAGNVTGDYSEEAFFGRVSNLIKRRNPSGTAANPVTQMRHVRKNMVRIGLGTPTLDISETYGDWIGRDMSEQAAAFGKMLAEERLADYLSRAVSVLTACTVNRADVKYDATVAPATAKMSYSNLALAADKFGDRAGYIRSWFMHTSARTALLLGNLANTTSLFSFGTVNVMSDAEGRAIISCDLSDLISGANRLTLGLTEAAMVTEENPDFQSNTERTNGLENIMTTYQSQWSANISPKGYSFDTSLITQGVPPTDAALATPASWTRHVDSHKDTAGVLLVTTV
jgi:hypothetical protein